MNNFTADILLPFCLASMTISLLWVNVRLGQLINILEEMNIEKKTDEIVDNKNELIFYEK